MRTAADDFTLVRPNRLCERLVFADGIGRSGKGMLSRILGTLESVEKQSNHTVFDWVPYLHFLNRMSTDAAIMYLQTEADQQVYNVMMSRDVNFRPRDATGVLQNARPFEYLRRLFGPEGDAVVERVRRDRPILNEAPHDALRSASLFFDAFSHSLKIIYILRDPFDVILAWHRRGFGHRIGCDPREFQFSLERRGHVIPMFMLDYEYDERYQELDEMERLVLMVGFCLRHNLNGLQALDAAFRPDVQIVPFEDLLTEPWTVVERMCGLLGTAPTRSTGRTLKKERLPRGGADRRGSVFGSVDETPGLRPHDELKRVVAAQCRDEILPFIDQLDREYARFQELVPLYRH